LQCLQLKETTSMKNPVSQVRPDGLLIRESEKGHTEFGLVAV